MYTVNKGPSKIVAKTRRGKFHWRLLVYKCVKSTINPKWEGRPPAKSVAVMSQHAAAAGRSSAAHALNILWIPSEPSLLLQSHSRISLLCSLLWLYFLPANQNLHSNNNKQTLSFTGLAQNFEKFESIKESSKKNGSNISFDLNSPEKNKK